MKTLPCLAMCLSPLLLASTPPRVAQHGPWTVFGQILGQPLTVPECRHKLMGDGTPFSTYEDDPAVTCYEPDIALRDAPWRRGSLDFPLRQIPLIIHGSSGFTLIVNGRLEGLEFDTLNYSNRRGIVSELSAKFGPPSSHPGSSRDPRSRDAVRVEPPGTVRRLPRHRHQRRLWQSAYRNLRDARPEVAS